MPQRAPAAVRDGGRRTPMPPRDPFFDQPYEPSAAPAAAWDAAPKAPAAVPGRGLSPNIRPKKKLASLLGGSR